MSINKPQVICIMGPTAIGKTSLAIDLYDLGFPIDIISVDSAMVYKGLDIGSGKPTQDILNRVPHGLVDIREPFDVYTVADFYQDVLTLVRQSHANNRVPCLVGGTMMYFNALFNGLAKLPSSDPAIRSHIGNLIREHGLQKVYNDLAVIDPITAKKINANDTQRIIRALEVFIAVGQPMSELLKQTAGTFSEFKNFACTNVILAPEPPEINVYKNQSSPRIKLHEVIAARFHMMLDDGFIEEVELLYKNPNISPLLPAIKSCGYQQIWQYLAGELKYEAMVENSISATRQLAKRQLTWLRNGLRLWSNTHWLNVYETDYKAEIIKLLKF